MALYNSIKKIVNILLNNRSRKSDKAMTSQISSRGA